MKLLFLAFIAYSNVMGTLLDGALQIVKGAKLRSTTPEPDMAAAMDSLIRYPFQGSHHLDQMDQVSHDIHNPLNDPYLNLDDSKNFDSEPGLSFWTQSDALDKASQNPTNEFQERTLGTNPDLEYNDGFERTILETWEHSSNEVANKADFQEAGQLLGKSEDSTPVLPPFSEGAQKNPLESKRNQNQGTILQNFQERISPEIATRYAYLKNHPQVKKMGITEFIESNSSPGSIVSYTASEMRLRSVLLQNDMKNVLFKIFTENNPHDRAILSAIQKLSADQKALVLAFAASQKNWILANFMISKGVDQSYFITTINQMITHLI